jgi:endonuclease YncB( thermonuclease family)
VDGDTIEVAIDGQEYKVRYIGIDTPESVDPRRPVECFGKEAADKNQELVEGKIVGLEKDVSETDAFGRLLRYVWLDGRLINARLVSAGYARGHLPPGRPLCGVVRATAGRGASIGAWSVGKRVRDSRALARGWSDACARRV